MQFPASNPSIGYETNQAESAGDLERDKTNAIGGALAVQSKGSGRDARFILKLPCMPEDRAA